MGLFLNPDKTRKSPHIMFGFLLGILFACVFGGLYMLLTVPLYEAVQIAGNVLLTTALHCLIVAALGTAVCCLLFLVPDKRLVPIGFAFLGVFMLAFYCAALLLAPEVRAPMFYFITLHFLAPVLLGNAVSWAIYLRVRKTPEKALRAARF